MATILINFQQKFALVRSLQYFAIKFLNQKRFLACFSASTSSLSWQEKCDVILHQLYLASDPINLASENDVTQLSQLKIHVQKRSTA